MTWRVQPKGARFRENGFVEGEKRFQQCFVERLRLIPLLHHEALALLIVQFELRNCLGLGCLLVRRLDNAKVLGLGALSQNRDAPRAQLGGGGFLLEGPHISDMAAVMAECEACGQEKAPDPGRGYSTYRDEA